MKLDENLFWARVAQAINEKEDMPDLEVSDELQIKRLTYENKKLKEKVDDLEETLEIAELLGSSFMKQTFFLMKLIRESGHDEIIDKFHEMMKNEIKKMERKTDVGKKSE